jgi:hypothetical protein
MPTKTGRTTAGRTFPEVRVMKRLLIFMEELSHGGEKEALPRAAKFANAVNELLRSR